MTERRIDTDVLPQAEGAAGEDRGGAATTAAPVDDEGWDHDPRGLGPMPVPEIAPVRAPSGMGAWTPDEDRIATEMLGRGATAREVAQALGRPVAGTQWRINKKLRPAMAGGDRSGPFTATERDEVQRLLAQGLGVDDIAVKLRRSVQSVAGHINVAKRLDRAETVGMPGFPSVAAMPPVPKVASVDLAPPFRGGAAEWQIALQALLDHLGNPAPFTPEIDLEIMERQVRGDKASAIALDMGIDLPRLRQRVIALLPQTGMTAQVRLLGALRERVDARDK